ncbi:MAG: omptin family outer membrane protease [Treponema sp.]|jgi:outer membrane protease|nr:omptin family outer membrane protease [Treponema sp.]
MKIVYAFAFFVSICGGAVFPAVSYGEDLFEFAIAKTSYRISLAANAGTLIGRAEEIVYKYADKDVKTSQLFWDLKPMVYLGFALSFSRADLLAGPGAAVDLSVKFGLPLKSGTMEDRDWRDPDPEKLTDFSTHDAYLGGGTLLFDFAGGISFPIKSAVAIKALFAVSYMQFSWDGRDGYGNYMNIINGTWKRHDYQGTVITYDQAWLIISPGIGFFLPLGRALTLDFRFFISPLIYAGAEDNHITTDTRYNDYMRGGLCLEPSLDIAFSPNRFFSLVLRGSWRNIAGTRGDTSENGSFYLRTDGAGAGFSALDAGLSLQFALPLGGLEKHEK